MYKPPNSLVDYWNIFGTNIEKVLECNLPFFLVGDFNVSFLLDHHQTSQFKLLLQRPGLSNVTHNQLTLLYLKVHV